MVHTNPLCCWILLKNLCLYMKYAIIETIGGTKSSERYGEVSDTQPVHMQIMPRAMHTTKTADIAQNAVVRWYFIAIYR